MDGLVVDNLYAGYGPKTVLNGLSALFPARSVTAIIGPNGAGKSTLLRVICGLVSPRAGSVTYLGNDLLALTTLERALSLAMVMQLNPPALPLTVRQFIELAGYARERKAQAQPATGPENAAQAAQELGVSSLLDLPLGALSGGEYRKVLLAQGIAQRTPVLLLDEPVAFLDPPARHEVMQLLNKLAHERNTCVIVVLHDELLAYEYCQHAVLLKGGTTTAAGTAEAVITPALLAELYGTEHILSTWKNLK
jgi:iron complex transport system ATP-binding protein